MQPYFSFLVVQIEARLGLGSRVVNFSSYLFYRAGFNNYNYYEVAFPYCKIIK